MTSIALGIFMVFIIYVMIWSIRNDGARSIGEQTGFIRMRVPPGSSSKAADKKAGSPRPKAGPASGNKQSRRHAAEAPAQGAATPTKRPRARKAPSPNRNAP